MKKLGFISMILGLGIIYANSQDSIVSIPDTNFLHALINEGVDTNGDSKISYAEAEAVTELIVSSNGISSLEGIQAFTHLYIISVDNNSLSSLDFTNNNALSGISCQDNQLTSLDISKNTVLTALECDGNALTSLDVTNNKALWRLQCYDNLLISLDISKNLNLEGLVCYNNQLSSLDVSNNTALTALDCNGNTLTRLDVSKNTYLEGLYCSGNQLRNLNVSNNTDLRRLYCENNQLTNIDLSQNIDLEYLHLSGNQLTVLDISNNHNLNEPFGPWPPDEVSLSIADIPSLTEVCVWEEFLSDQFSNYDTTGSPNVYFTTECATETEKWDCENITIYPNPTYDLLTIETEQPEQKRIEITSLNGQLLIHREMLGASHQFDLSPFQKGVYFITIRSEDFVTTRKIIKL